MAVLTLKNIGKSFGTLTVLDSVSVELREGELLVLLGPSGCGKSTLLRLIAGLEKLDSGEIYLDDRRIDHLIPKDRNVAMVFQNYALYPHMTVENNLAFPLKVAGMSKTEIAERVSAVAEMLGLTDKLEHKPGQLSGGQRQRVALGRAIVREPSLFLLDEPLSNLDADLRSRMRLEIVRLQRELKTTTIHVTHDQVEALTMADRIALLREGKLVQVGTPEELYSNPNSLYVAEFIGSPRINVVEASIKDKVLTPFGFPVAEYYLENEATNIKIGLRPEAVSIKPGGEFKGVVNSCEYLGEQYVVKLGFAQTDLLVSGCKQAYQPGDLVTFSFDQKDLMFFKATDGARIR